jgi:hypothetical protein
MKLPGQGKSLPHDCPFRGQWLIEDVLFLYEPHGPERRFLRGFKPAEGEWSVGFDANVIAGRLGVDAGDLFSANESGALALILEEAPGCARMGETKRYVFTLGEAETGVILQGNERIGQG